MHAGAFCREERLRGISTSVLTERLNRLEDERLITRRTLPPPAASKVYELTEDGQELAQAIVPLAAWVFDSLQRTVESAPKRSGPPGGSFTSVRRSTLRLRTTCTMCMSFTSTTP